MLNYSLPTLGYSWHQREYSIIESSHGTKMLHSIILTKILKRSQWMQTKSLKIRCFCLLWNSSLYSWRSTNHSRAFCTQLFVTRDVYRGELHFKVNAQQPNFMNWFLCIHYCLCKFSIKIIEWIIFALYNFLHWTLYKVVVSSLITRINYWRNCAERVWWPSYIGIDSWFLDDFWEASSSGFHTSSPKA